MARRVARGRWMGLCPLHSDHKPSFLVDPTKSLFYCYGCGRGGDVIRFAELYHQVKFPQALVLLHPMAWPGAVITPMTFHLSADTYGLNQLRYDLRKLKGHGLLERDDSRYAYRLTAKGVQVALLFLFFHSNSAALLPTAGFITSRIPATGLIANSKPRTTRQTRPFSKSLICSPQRDVTSSNVEVFLFTIFELRI
jgi:hypothetical protein